MKIDNEIKRKSDKNTNSSRSIVSNQENNIKMTCVNLENLIDFCYNIFYIRQAYDFGKEKLKILKKFVKENLPEKIFSHEGKLKQLLINLMSNAYKFTVTGYIEISCEKIYDTELNKKRQLI